MTDDDGDDGGDDNEDDEDGRQRTDGLRRTMDEDGRWRTDNGRTTDKTEPNLIQRQSYDGLPQSHPAARTYYDVGVTTGSTTLEQIINMF